MMLIRPWRWQVLLALTAPSPRQPNPIDVFLRTRQLFTWTFFNRIVSTVTRNQCLLIIVFASYILFRRAMNCRWLLLQPVLFSWSEKHTSSNTWVFQLGPMSSSSFIETRETSSCFFDCLIASKFPESILTPPKLPRLSTLIPTDRASGNPWPFVPRQPGAINFLVQWLILLSARLDHFQYNVNNIIIIQFQNTK